MMKNPLKSNMLSLLSMAVLSLMLSACGPDKPQYIEGYYRQGFEQSDFFPVGGGGPYWLEADGEVWEELLAFYVDAPGRGGGMTLHLIVEGDLQTGGGYGLLGAYEARLTVTSILIAEPVSEEEFQAAVSGMPSEPVEQK